MNASGKFIVIEGTDGSGKTAQFERLVLALPEGIRLGALDFPRYSEPASFFVQKYLKGRYGGEVGPHAASIFYALDRFDAKLKILQWFEEGRLVVANRYVASSMAYQGAKLDKQAEREHFYKWLYNLEYEIFGVPKPDLNIVLHVPAEISRELLAQRGGHPVRGEQDVREMDLEHQKRAEQVYLEISRLFPRDFHVIECAPEGVLLSQEEIHQAVWAAVRQTLGL